MPEYQASYRRCQERSGRLRRTLESHSDVTILAEETGGWFVEATEEAILQLETETELVFKEVGQA